LHDFLLAKEIIDELEGVAQEKKLSGVLKVYIEIGSIALTHDGHPEHTEDISIENLEFGLKNIAKGTDLEHTQFFVEKVPGSNWKITNIEIE
jgi:Zn finger protein HypA/HybF involved in hydrogenase expression